MTTGPILFLSSLYTSADPWPDTPSPWLLLTGDPKQQENGWGAAAMGDSITSRPAHTIRIPRPSHSPARTTLEDLLLQAATRLEISCMSVQRAQKKASAALRQRLAGVG